jgi:hypothetical protein
MAMFVFSYFSLICSVVLVAVLRMGAWQTSFSYLNLGLHLMIQAAIAALYLWISSIFEPITPHSVFGVAVMLVLEAVFRVVRRLR